MQPRVVWRPAATRRMLNRGMTSPRALSLFMLLLAACFQSGAGNGGAGASDQPTAGAAGANANAGAAGDGAAGNTAASGAPSSAMGPGWQPVGACGAECACDGGSFAGVWVCEEGAEPTCACDDAATRGQTCTPGATVTCTCADGSRGSQACTPDGLGFGACSCG